MVTEEKVEHKHVTPKEKSLGENTNVIKGQQHLTVTASNLSLLLSRDRQKTKPVYSLQNTLFLIFQTDTG